MQELHDGKKILLGTYLSKKLNLPKRLTVLENQPRTSNCGVIFFKNWELWNWNLRIHLRCKKSSGKPFYWFKKNLLPLTKEISIKNNYRKSHKQ